MKKKILVLAMFILLMLAAVPSAMAACSHTYRWVTRNPTCTVNGAKQYKCIKCGSVASSQTLYATGHKPVLKSIIKPTCTTNGAKIYKCSVCTAQKTETIKATGHDYYVPGYVEPNCIRASLKITKCYNCDYYKEEIVPKNPNNHAAMSYVYVSHERCETNGLKEYKCGGCGYVDISKDQIVKATGHNYVDDAAQNYYPCDEVQYKKQTCTHDRCEKKHRTVKVRDPIPHEEIIQTIAATQTKHGYNSTYCAVCHKVLKDETIHNFQKKNSLKCNESGDIQYKCTVAGCLEMYTVFHKPESHDWTDWHNGTRECRKCNAKEGY